MSKGETMLSQVAWFLFFLWILCTMDIFFKRIIIYQSGITMNMSNTHSVTVLSNLQFKQIFSVFKKSCKNEYNCLFGMCLCDIITSSRINLIIFSIGFFCLIKRLKVTPVSYNLMKWEKITFFWVVLIELKRVHHFF